MTTAHFALTAWAPDQTAVLEAWGHDRRGVLQAGLDAALTLMFGESGQLAADDGLIAPLRGEGESIPGLFGDLLDDLVEQIAVHGPIQSAALDGVLKRDRGGFVAWGYLSPGEQAPPGAPFERVGDVEAVVETPEEIRLRVTLRRLA